MEELTQALSELIIENGGTPPSEDNLEENPRKGILSSCIMLRCNHCGHLEFFDRLFVEDQIHGKK